MNLTLVNHKQTLKWAARTNRPFAWTLPFSMFGRHSPDGSETRVDSSDFAASLEARREMWMATSSSAARTMVEVVDLAIFPKARLKYLTAPGYGSCGFGTRRRAIKRRLHPSQILDDAPATTLYAARGRLIPFNSNSPTDSTLTVFSTLVSTRGLISICPRFASSHKLLFVGQLGRSVAVVSTVVPPLRITSSPPSIVRRQMVGVLRPLTRTRRLIACRRHRFRL
jgi:hypothetical protein